MENKENKMKEIKIEKVVLSIGGTGEALDKGEKLLNRLTSQKPARKKSKRRIPTLGVRPGLEVGCMVTLRGKKALELLRRLLQAVDNKIKEKQISDNTFSFGVKEYIEIPGVKYQRDIGIIGFDVSVTFARAGKRVIKRKIKRSKIPRKQMVKREEIIEYLKNKLNVTILGKK